MLDKSYKALQETLTYLEGDYFENVIETFSNLLDLERFQADKKYTPEVKQKLTDCYTKIDPKDYESLLKVMILQAYKTQNVQANHQMTPDNIGLLLSYLLVKVLPTKKQIDLLDISIGTGNLLFTLFKNLNLQNKHLNLSGIDNDDTQLTLASLNATIQKIDVNLYHQDALEILPLKKQDVIIGDLAVGYYPLDERIKDFTTKIKSGHSYTHHLIIEQSLRYLKDDGSAVFVVPNDLFSAKNGAELLSFIKENAYLQAYLQLPSDLFTNNKAKKALLFLQKPGANTKQATQVLLASCPSLKDQTAFVSFIKQFDSWLSKL